MRSGCRVDAAIANRLFETPSRFSATPLYMECYVVVLPPDHPLAGSVLKERRIALYAKFRSAREDWVQSMVLAGMGFAVMPEYSVTHPDVVVRPLVAPELKREIALLRLAAEAVATHVNLFAQTASAFEWPG